MIPGPLDPRWRSLLMGELNFKFKSPTAGMAIGRMRRSVLANPTPENLQANIQEAREFFLKYEGVMRDELAQLFA